MKNLTDKAVLVSGAAKGIGRATALAFAQEGSNRLVITEIDANGLEGTADMLEAMQVYHEIGYRYAIMPDHWPKLTGDTPLGLASRAYAHGYIKAGMQAVGAKPRTAGCAVS